MMDVALSLQNCDRYSSSAHIRSCGFSMKNYGEFSHAILYPLRKAAYLWPCYAPYDANLWRHSWPWPGFMPVFFRISFTLLLARGMLSYRALRGYSWDVIGSGKACSGSACVGEFLTWVNCFFFRVMSLLLRLRPLWRVHVTGLYSAFGNLLRCNC